MPEITREAARALVGQFTAFAPLPQATEGLTLTIDTLIACARSEAHAKRIVREIVEAPGDPARWPAPERIRSVAWSLLSDGEKNTNCERCGGSGFVHVVRVIKGVPLDFADTCSCRQRVALAVDKPKRDSKMAAIAEDDFPW